MRPTEDRSPLEALNEKKRPDGEVLCQGQFCDVGHGRAPFLSDEYAIDMTHRERRRTRRLHQFILLSVLVVFVLHWRFSAWGLSYGELDHSGMNAGVIANDPSSFNWTAHPSSRALNWTECYDGFQCARLTVPLLYSEPSGEEGAVALIKSPSKYPPDNEKYRGPILFNPGGPGGSGIQLVLLLERAFRKILSDEFDLIGFDPRGVGFTTPVMSVFKDQVEAGKFYVQYPTNVNISASALGEAYTRSRILGNLAADRAQFVAERVSTPTVARDMRSIIKAAGQDKLQYWGFSYGTVLGATFAAMFPDNVGRVIIDGVVDTEDYYNASWANNLRDTDAALMDIYQACVRAGPSKCPIYENSTSRVQARVDRLLNKLRSAPMVLYDSSTPPLSNNYEVIDYGMVRQVIFTVLYTTHGSGAYLADALAALEHGDPSKIYMISIKRLFNSLIECNCPTHGDAPAPFTGEFEITYAISCGDAVDRSENLESVRKAYEDMAKSSSFAETWPPRVPCSGWKSRAKERFNGSFELSTSHPLLLIGNVADPVTPLWNAFKMSKSFKDSVVLTQNSSGHCSISAASLCTVKAIREYFINGTLPAKGTVCAVQSSIFGEADASLDALSMEERELVEASQMLQKNYFVPILGGVESIQSKFTIED